jgi:hypothetical protein
VQTWLQDGRLKFVKDFSSVLVRLLDGQRPRQLATPATSTPPAMRTIPPYATSITAAMNIVARSKAYRRAVPANMTEEAFVADLTATATQLAGIADGNVQGSLLAYGEGSGREGSTRPAGREGEAGV